MKPCLRCKTPIADIGPVRCDPCREEHCRYYRGKGKRKPLREARDAAGLCRECGAPAREQRTRCVRCASRRSTQLRGSTAHLPPAGPLTRKQREARGIVLTPPMLIGSKKRPLSRGEHVRACAGPQDGRDVVSARPRPEPATFEARTVGEMWRCF